MLVTVSVSKLVNEIIGYGFGFLIRLIKSLVVLQVSVTKSDTNEAITGFDGFFKKPVLITAIKIIKDDNIILPNSVGLKINMVFSMIFELR